MGLVVGMAKRNDLDVFGDNGYTGPSSVAGVFAQAIGMRLVFPLVVAVYPAIRICQGLVSVVVVVVVR